MSSQDRDWMHGLNRDVAHNIERQLRDMESMFLGVLAEHQAQGIVSDDTAAPAAEAPSPDRVKLTIAISRADYHKYFDAMMHFWDHGCETGTQILVTLGGAVVNGLTPKAYDAGWFDEEEEGHGHESEG